MSTEVRPQTKIDRIAEDWVDTLVEHDPTTGTYLGRAESNGRLPDYSPAGAEALAEAQRATLQLLEQAEPVDDVDRVTKTDLAAGLRLALARHEMGESLRNLNVIESPSQNVRDNFDLMPRDTEQDWQSVAERMRAVQASLEGYRSSLAEGASQGLAPAIRQVREVTAQARRVAGDGTSGFFSELAAGAAESGASEALQRELADAAQFASRAYDELAAFLEKDLAPHAAQADAFGRERYELASEEFLGLKVDLDETYEWGLDELARMVDEQQRIAAEITGSKPHAGIVAEAIAQLEADPERKLHGTAALKRWMQQTSDRAVEELGRTQFDIPEEIRTLECLIAPTQEGGIYYTGPSDDLTRPGRMWWSVPEGVTEFDTWRELTTVYHEGVPGHHLQIATAAVNRGSLNEWRRQLAGTSGQAEGWALYAERLMEQLGYLDDPADRLGMLDGQRMRAARVVLDIGVHLGKVRPDGEAVWSGDYALEFMRENVNMNEGFVKFEVNRYLGWAGQAPSYKIGQRIWEQLRDEAAAQAVASGREFDIRDFHRRALDLGVIRLDTLQRAMRGEL